MIVIYIILGLISSFIASYVSALGLVYAMNMFFWGVPMDIFAFLQCPLTAACVEFGAELQTQVIVTTCVIFVLCGIIAPIAYYKLKLEA